MLIWLWKYPEILIDRDTKVSQIVEGEVIKPASNSAIVRVDKLVSES
jgi:hypothetical protein